MMLRLLLFIVLIPGISKAQTDYWAVFSKTRFEVKYSEKAQEYLNFPVFPAEVKALEGKVISVEGYYLPVDVVGEAYVIISKYPYSQCFFCGGAGPETIAEVSFKTKPPKFTADQYIRVKGKLKLNLDDIDRTNFILQEAELIQK
ncbi:MAG: hypothetical protein ACO263_05515 [Cyclobacteriaceae bacterium]